MPSLKQRRRVPEIMDRPDLEPRRHAGALHGLARLNFFSRSAGLLWPALADLARRRAPAPVRVLDVATGAGDVPVRLARRARAAGLDLRFSGCDISPTAVGHARQRAGAAGVAVDFFPLDVLAGPLPGGFDAVTCSLFLHHLDDGQACDLLRRLAAAAGVVLVNDLERNRLGLALAHVACRLLSRSDVVHYDGPRSVEAAFTVAEVRELAGRAGLGGAAVTRHWPWRFLLAWRRS